MKVLSEKDILDKFVHRELTISEEESDYTHLSIITGEIYANLAQLWSRRGGGNNGHIGDFMRPTLYATHSATPWVDPPTPPIDPPYPNGGACTQAQRDIVKETWDRDVAEYSTWTNSRNVIRKQIVDAVPSACLDELRHRIRGFFNVTPRAMIDLILKRSGKITDTLKQQNKAAFSDSYDPGLPISSYFKRIEDAVQLADDSGMPYTPEQILDQAVYQMRACKLYKEEIKTWKDKAAVDRTWDNFKTHFADAYFEKKEDNEFGSKGAGYQATTEHGANAATTEHSANIAEALNNLAFAVSSDSDQFKNLTAANNTLADQLKVALDQNKVLTTLLSKKIGGMAHTTDDAEKEGRPNKRARAGGRPLNTDPWDPNGYCWTHGFKVRVGHNSWTCGGQHTDKKHKREATRDKTLGGSQVNKDWKFSVKDEPKA